MFSSDLKFCNDHHLNHYSSHLTISAALSTKSPSLPPACASHPHFDPSPSRAAP